MFIRVKIQSCALVSPFCGESCGGETAPGTGRPGGSCPHFVEVPAQDGGALRMIRPDFLKSGCLRAAAEFFDCLFVRLNCGQFPAEKAVADIDALVLVTHSAGTFAEGMPTGFFPELRR